jgi:hypothetical protein
MLSLRSSIPFKQSNHFPTPMFSYGFIYYIQHCGRKMSALSSIHCPHFVQALNREQSNHFPTTMFNQIGF